MEMKVLKSFTITLDEQNDTVLQERVFGGWSNLYTDIGPLGFTSSWNA